VEGGEGERSVHVCSKCKWPFANAYPSQKKRSAHRRQCGKIEGYPILSTPAKITEYNVLPLMMKMEEDTALQNSDVIKQMKNPDSDVTEKINLNGMNQEETPKCNEPMDPVTPNEEENQSVALPSVESNQSIMNPHLHVDELMDPIIPNEEENQSAAPSVESKLNSHLQVDEPIDPVTPNEKENQSLAPSVESIKNSHLQVEEEGSHVVDSDNIPAGNIDFVPEESESLKLDKVAATPDIVLNEALENHSDASNDAVSSLVVNFQEDREDVLDMGIHFPEITLTEKEIPISYCVSAISNGSESEPNTYNISSEEIATNEEYTSSVSKIGISESNSISETGTETTGSDCDSPICDVTTPPTNYGTQRSNSYKDSATNPKGKKTLEIKPRVVSWNNVEDEIASERKKHHDRWMNAIGEASNRHGMLRRYNSLPHDNSYMVRLQLCPSIYISGYKEQKTPIASKEIQVHSPMNSSSEKKMQKDSNSSSSNKKSALKSSSSKPKRKRKIPWLPILCCPTICQNIS